MKARGLKQSQGGHYLLPIDQFSDSLSVPADLHVPSHLVLARSQPVSL